MVLFSFQGKFVTYYDLLIVIHVHARTHACTPARTHTRARTDAYIRTYRTHAKTSARVNSRMCRIKEVKIVVNSSKCWSNVNFCDVFSEYCHVVQQNITLLASQGRDRESGEATMSTAGDHPAAPTIAADKSYSLSHDNVYRRRDPGPFSDRRSDGDVPDDSTSPGNVISATNTTRLLREAPGAIDRELPRHRHHNDDVDGHFPAARSVNSGRFCYDHAHFAPGLWTKDGKVWIRLRASAAAISSGTAVRDVCASRSPSVRVCLIPRIYQCRVPTRLG